MARRYLIFKKHAKSSFFKKEIEISINLIDEKINEISNLEVRKMKFVNSVRSKLHTLISNNPIESIPDLKIIYDPLFEHLDSYYPNQDKLTKDLPFNYKSKVKHAFENGTLAACSQRLWTRSPRDSFLI